MLKLVSALITAVLALALLGGCGGGDDATTEAETLTKAEFIAQANAICTKAEKKRNASVAAAIKSQEAKEKEEINLGDQATIEELMVAGVLPVARQMTEELAALGPPDAKAAAIVDAYEATVEGTDADPGRFMRRGMDPLGKARVLAVKYGLEVCGRI